MVGFTLDLFNTLEGLPMGIYKVTYNFKDGGSAWIVKAEDREAAVIHVKNYFHDEFDRWYGRFYAERICDEEGEVFCGS